MRPTFLTKPACSDILHEQEIELLHQQPEKKMIRDKIQSTLGYLADKKLKTYINMDLMEQIISRSIVNHKHYQFYIDFILGYYTNKNFALEEDIEFALDTAKFFRENPSLYASLNDVVPFELGQICDKVREIMDGHTISMSKNMSIALKTRGELLDGMSHTAVYEDETYTVYFIAALNKGRGDSEAEIEKQHILYCSLGKSTDWCTATATGTYYKHYIYDDIYVIFMNGKPKYQLNIRDGDINQFMNIQDSSVGVLSKSLLSILEKALARKGKSVKEKRAKA